MSFERCRSAVLQSNLKKHIPTHTETFFKESVCCVLDKKREKKYNLEETFDIIFMSYQNPDVYIETSVCVCVDPKRKISTHAFSFI